MTSGEQHTLTIGVAYRLLHKLRRDLARTQQEKVDLLHQIDTYKEELAQFDLPHSDTYPKTEIFYQILRHNWPLESVMRHHRAYGGLHLLLSTIPFIKTGCHIEFSQMQELWTHVDAAAKDTMAFMWSLGELKTPQGVMETVSGSSTFYIKRYILRCIALLAQQHNMIQVPKEPFPTLKSYTHSQIHVVTNFQRSKMQCFDHALINLAMEDTAICYEAMQHYQTLASKFPDGNLHPTLSQIKDFVTKTLEEQQTTISRRRFGTISSDTLQFKPKDQTTEHSSVRESMGICFLWAGGVKCSDTSDLSKQQSKGGEREKAKWLTEASIVGVESRPFGSYEEAKDRTGPRTSKADWREPEGELARGKDKLPGDEDKLAENELAEPAY